MGVPEVPLSSAGEADPTFASRTLANLPTQVPLPSPSKTAKRKKVKRILKTIKAISDGAGRAGIGDESDDDLIGDAGLDKACELRRRYAELTVLVDNSQYGSHSNGIVYRLSKNLE